MTVLLIGKLKPYKGADVFIRAAAILPDALRKRARFVIAGKPYMDVSDLREARPALRRCGCVRS